MAQPLVTLGYYFDVYDNLYRWDVDRVERRVQHGSQIEWHHAGHTGHADADVYHASQGSGSSLAHLHVEVALDGVTTVRRVPGLQMPTAATTALRSPVGLNPSDINQWSSTGSDDLKRIAHLIGKNSIRRSLSAGF